MATTSVNRQITAVLDIGSAVVKTIVSRAHAGESLEVLGIGTAPSRGVNQGTVINMDEAAEAITASLTEAARAAGVSPGSALIAFSGTHVEMLPCPGELRHSGGPRLVTEGHLDSALQAAYPAHIPAGKELVHLIARQYSLDGTAGVRRPLGMHAQQLDVDALAILAGMAQMENLAKAVRKSGISVNGFVLTPLAVGEAILTSEERHLGVLVLDIGGGTTKLSYFHQGVFWAGDVVTFAGGHLTRDLAVVLGIPTDAAEHTKLTMGTTRLSRASTSERVELPTFEEGVTREIAHKDLARILYERAKEILELARGRLENMGLDHTPAAGVVLTGASAGLPGLKELAQEVFRTPARIGAPHEFRGSSVEEPAFSAGVGALLWGMRHVTNIRANRRPDEGFSRRLVRHFPGLGRRTTRFDPTMEEARR